MNLDIERVWDVYLNDGSIRTYEDRPFVGEFGELYCRIQIVTREGHSTSYDEDYEIYAAGRWTEIQPVTVARESEAKYHSVNEGLDDNYQKEISTKGSVQSEGENDG